MSDNTALQQLIGIAGVPIIMALVQVLRPWLGKPDNYPLAALVIGLAINIGFTALTRGDTVEAAAAGILAGLAASGLYEIGRQYAKPKPTHAQTNQEDV